MKTRIFGRTGIEVSQIGLGAWPIGQKEQEDGSVSGSYGLVDPQEARGVVERYVELGGTFIDTARGYGTSEEIIGSCSFMKQDRERMFITTKTHSTRALELLPQIERDLDTSLRNLGTDYVDLFQIHTPPDDPELMKRVIEIYVRLRESGKIRAIGASVKGQSVTPATVTLAKRYVDTGEIDALQLVYSIFRRQHEETLAYAHQRNVAIIARTVIENGFLSGKYRPDADFSDHRRRWDATHRHRLLECAADLAQRVDSPYSLAQTAIRFALERPEVSVVIPGAKRVEQVEANCAVDEMPPLSSAMRQAIEALPEDVATFANPSRY